MSISFKSIVLSLSLVLASAFTFAGNEVQPVDAVETVIDVPASCTVSGTVSNGSVSIDFDVTADTCAEAASGLAAIVDALQ